MTEAPTPVVHCDHNDQHHHNHHPLSPILWVVLWPRDLPAFPSEVGVVGDIKGM
jgi:hypothetical protein